MKNKSEVIIEIISKHMGVPNHSIRTSTSFKELGVDDLDIEEINMSIQEQLGLNTQIGNDSNIANVQDLINNCIPDSLENIYHLRKHKI